MEELKVFVFNGNIKSYENIFSEARGQRNFQFSLERSKVLPQAIIVVSYASQETRSSVTDVLYTELSIDKVNY
jgi:hypothetical protein